MKKSEENEEKWRKLEKSGYKTKKSIHKWDISHFLLCFPVPLCYPMKKNEENEKSGKNRRKVEKCDYKTKISQMPDTHTPRWHMERNLDFVATFLHFSSFFSTMLKSEENEEKWRKRKKSKGNEEKWRKWRKVKNN